MKKLILPTILFLALALAPVVAVAHPSAHHTIELLSESIATQPDNQALYVRRGKAYSDEGLLELALADLRKAETLGDPALAAFDLGVVYYRMGDLAASRRSFDLFLKHFPDHAPALEYRARVFRDSGDSEAALADFRRYFALQKQPNPGDYVSAAVMLAGLEGQGVVPALAMLDEGTERLGLTPQLQSYAIELELRRGNTAGAIERLEGLKPLLGDSPDWKVDMGELLVLAGKPDEARPFFAAASSQLQALRTTSARRQLRTRLDKLQASLDEGSSTPPAS